jgi:hypothetical protein
MSGNGSACGMWGFTDQSAQSANAMRTGGTLQVSISAASVHAGCGTNMNFDLEHGASIQVLNVTPTAGDTIYFTVTFPTSSFVTMQIRTGATPTVEWMCSGPGGGSNPIAFTPGGYLKIARSTTSANIQAMRSPDGTSWTSIASCSFTGENVSKAGVRFGIMGGPMAGTRGAVFDELKTCTTPP